MEHTVTLENTKGVALNPIVAAERLQALEALKYGVIQVMEAGHGPYFIDISVVEQRVQFQVKGQHSAAFAIAVSPLKMLIKDYFILCDSYNKMAGALRPDKLEAIDMGRRGLHNQAAELVQTLLKDKAVVDFDTARTLFTLICVLHIRQGV